MSYLISAGIEPNSRLRRFARLLVWGTTMQEFLLGMFVILIPSILFMAWLLWQTAAPDRRNAPISATDNFDRD